MLLPALNQLYTPLSNIYDLIVSFQIIYHYKLDFNSMT